MNTTHTRTKFLTATVGAAIAAVAAPALLFLGAGTAQAIQDVSDSMPGVTIGTFNPQPDTPGVDDPDIKVGILDPGSKVSIGDPGIRPPSIIDPGIKVGIIDPGIKVGIGGPDTRPAP